jgi:hypothetical protein
VGFAQSYHFVFRGGEPFPEVGVGGKESPDPMSSKTKSELSCTHRPSTWNPTSHHNHFCWLQAASMSDPTKVILKEKNLSSVPNVDSACKHLDLSENHISEFKSLAKLTSLKRLVNVDFS